MSSTLFPDLKVGKRKWFMAIYLMTAHKKGISSHQLSTDLGVKQKTAWSMIHRIQRIFKSKPFNAPVKGVVEADETYVGSQ